MPFVAGAGGAGAAGAGGAGVLEAGVLEAGSCTEAIVRLRMQRSVLAGIAAEIASAVRRVPIMDGSWRSDAQRAYTRKLGELEHELRSAWAALAEAIEEIDHTIAALEREGASRALTGVGVF
ncbi:MAG: hypothetical protein EPN48_03480 [Microbacteriaceae bacterium]|nr:MAG: hypothetical protein EPN48_03480 [Microbacteriaceae bacterium]